jgi:dihydroflavonol-4-reductase
VEADLLQPGSFDAAVGGCRYVFHTASPFFIDASDPQAQLVDPAVKGTLNLLGSVLKHKAGVRRVVITSSCAAVKGKEPLPPANGSTYSEEDWNTTSTVDAGEAYWVGKVGPRPAPAAALGSALTRPCPHRVQTEAERAAWEFCGREGIDLVAILPEFIMGELQPGRSAGRRGGGLLCGISTRARTWPAALSSPPCPPASARLALSPPAHVS